MRKNLILLFLLTLLPLNARPVLSKTEADETGYEETTDVTLTYRMEATEKVELTVSVKGSGSLKDGEEVIRNGVNVYELIPYSQKEFIVEPDPGSKVASLKINQEEVGDKFDDKVTLKGIKEDTFVKVVFKKIENGTKPIYDPSQNNGNDSNTGNVQKIMNGGILTGVNEPAGWMLLALFITGGVMKYTGMKKKAIDDEICPKERNDE